MRTGRPGHALTDRPMSGTAARPATRPGVARRPSRVRRRRAGRYAVHGPASPGWLLVALCVATGAYCLLRMRSPVEEQRRAAGGEALMGFGMAAMAVPAAVFTPPAWAWPGYAAVFGAAALRALWSARTSRHHLHHLVGAGAMVYMSVVMAASPESHHHGHGGSGIPLLTGALLLYFAGYVLLSGARLVP